MADRIILGIDPGTNIMGYGIIKVTKSKPEMVTLGVIHLSKYKDHYLKLQKIYRRVAAIIEEYCPDEMALEAPFFGKNVQSMLKLGRAQGVAMAAGLNNDIPITEYAPLKVKLKITGQGKASKEQVAGMLMKQLSLKEMPEYFDATDALAVALCHFHSTSGTNLPTSSGAKGWDQFLKQNPSRLKKRQQ